MAYAATHYNKKAAGCIGGRSAPAVKLTQLLQTDVVCHRLSAGFVQGQQVLQQLAAGVSAGDVYTVQRRRVSRLASAAEVVGGNTVKIRQSYQVLQRKLVVVFSYLE